MRRVLVTGATGFIGRHVVAALRRDCAVVAAVRGTPADLIADRIVSVGDIGDRTSWHEALVDVDAVVHLAALAHRRRKTTAERDLYREVNTFGTLALARAAASAGIRDFIFVSSIAVHGAAGAGRDPFRETDPFRPADVYGESKAEAERGLADIAAETGLACTVIRPPLVYGPGAPGSVALLERAFARRLPLPLASVRNRRAFVAVDNLAGFIAWRLGRSNRGAEAFIVADEGHLSTPDFVATLAEAGGERARLIPFAPILLSAGLRMAGRRSLVDSLLSSLEVDIAKARSTGWRPLSDTRTGLYRLFAAGGHAS